MKSPQRLILFPGLAADERMYSKLQVQQLQLITPRLLIPLRSEGMADYAARHAECLDIGSDDIVGGCSFGSMLASEVCRQRKTRALVLLSGALSSAALTTVALRINTFTRFSAAVIPGVIMRRLMMNSAFLRAVFGSADPVNLDLGRLMIQQTPSDLLWRGRRLATSYAPQQSLQCPVFALHGAQDRVLLPPAVDHCELIADAGHGMVVSHPHQVSRFLQDVYTQLTSQEFIV